MTISAGLVMQLRQRSGAGMMECKKALIATNGDIDQALTELRKSGQANKKENRIAAEGMIAIVESSDKASAVMLEVNSETDFAARAENFVAFANRAAETALKSSCETIDALTEETLLGSDVTVDQARRELVAVIGENIQLRRLVQVSAQNNTIGTYLHGARIGVIVVLKGGDEAVARDIAMHVAASRPLVVSADQVSAEVIEKEREIFTAQARESGKPQEIIDKMIDGRISKFVDEVCLSGQPFVKDPNIKVGQYLKNKQAEVLSFTRFEVGEGMEKKEDNFVEEVMAQARVKE